MLLFLICLFLVATAIGGYVAVSVAGALFAADEDRHQLTRAHPRI
jgi:hypothetical protein